MATLYTLQSIAAFLKNFANKISDEKKLILRINRFSETATGDKEASLPKL